MRLGRAARVVPGRLAAIAAPVTLPAFSWAQGFPSSSSRGIPSDVDMDGSVIVVLAVIALIAAIVIASKASDLKRKRTEQATALQSRITGALLTHPALGHLPITAMTTVPWRRRSPLTIRVSGKVPTAALRGAAMSLVIREAFDSGLKFRVEDRVAVAPMIAQVA